MLIVFVFLVILDLFQIVFICRYGFSILTFSCRMHGIMLTCDIVLEPVAVKTHSQEYCWIMVDQLEICLDTVRSKVMAHQALTMFSQTRDPRITRIYLKCSLPMLLQGCLSIAVVITLNPPALYRPAGISHSPPSLLFFASRCTYRR